MKQVAIVGERQAKIIDTPDPEPFDHWAVMKVDVAPMCTEYKSFMAGKQGGLVGHEAAGEVVAIDRPGRVQVGDRVVAMPLYGCGTCDLCVAGDYIHCHQSFGWVAASGREFGHSSMAQYLIKPDWLLMPIPDELTYEQAGLACCALGPSFGAFKSMDVGPGDTVLITGTGPVGMGAIVNARHRGAEVVVVESHPWRVDHAGSLGVAGVVDPQADDIVRQIREKVGGREIDYALDCSGSVQAQRLCIDTVRRKGKVAFVGECQDDLAIRVSPDMLRKGLTLIGAWHYNLRTFPEVMEVIRYSPLIHDLVSHEFPLSQIQDAFELQTTGACAKVLLKPWE